jgi:IclR family acetate operon transcriptional repressor
VSSAGKALQILFLLAHEAEPLGIHEIARRLEMTPPTVHRLLSVLAEHDLVQGGGRRSEYRLGWACLDLARGFLGGAGVAQAAPPIANRLRDETAETVTAQIAVEREQVCVFQAEGLHELSRRVAIGRRRPLHAGASGQAILAFMRADEIDAYLRGPLEQVGPSTLTDARSLRARLEEIRSAGVATSAGESAVGVVGLSVPVFGADGLVAGSLSVSGPQARLGSEAVAAIVPKLVDAGRSLSRELGYHEPSSAPARETLLVHA